MLTYEWLNRAKARFYKIEAQGNGNDGFILNYQWGSCISNRGGQKNISVSREEAEGIIKTMIKRRKSRGYELIAPLFCNDIVKSAHTCIT